MSVKIFYDGNCNLCNASVEYLRRKQKASRFVFIDQNSDEYKKLDLSFPDSIIVYNNGIYKIYSEAIIELIPHLKFPFNLLIIIKILPKYFRDKFYKIIANNRNLFNTSHKCDSNSCRN